jgi:DNA repair protein RadC
MYEYAYTRRQVSEAVTVSDSHKLVRAVAVAFKGAETERIVVAALDTKNQLLGYETVYIGNISAALVRVGELFRFPVRLNARSMIILHNHPSGDSTPSTDDLHLTAEVVAAGKLLDIPCLDHIIVAEGGFDLDYTSLRDRGVEFGR